MDLFEQKQTCQYDTRLLIILNFFGNKESWQRVFLLKMAQLLTGCLVRLKLKYVFFAQCIQSIPGSIHLIISFTCSY